MTAQPTSPDASASDATPLLAVRHLTAAYRTGDGVLPAVRDVSFDLHAGEVLALVGESAAGKTTVAQAILGLLPSQATIEGDVQYRGASLSGMTDEELRRVRGEDIAIIFQNALASLTPTLAIGDQLAEVYRAHRNMDQATARGAAIEVLRTVLPDPERVAEAFPFQLSGGMAQRVMIAMATALKPSVIIADEPTSSLDPAVRVETLDRLEGLRNEGAGVLLITHDFGVVARLADRVAVMYAGAVVETGDVRTIFRRPRHPYTFGLLQSLPSIARRGQLVPMRGQPPDLATMGPECPFLPRCSKAITQCRVEVAPGLEVADTGVEGHMVACYNPMQVDRAEVS
ncbi:MAG: ABC transporter ATP-binding protein [Dehalococcoidia bacterium]